MDAAKRSKLESRGWKVGDATTFLKLTPDEAAYVELKSRLAMHLRHVRCSHNLTQVVAARQIGSSQSRLAKMEAGDASVSLDLLLQSLFRLGVGVTQLGELLCTHQRPTRMAKRATSKGATAPVSPKRPRLRRSDLVAQEHGSGSAD